MAADERTPLLPDGTSNGHGNGHGNGNTDVSSKNPAGSETIIFGPANRILLAGFLMAFTLGITQVPILYVFRLMECEIFYQHNPPSPLKCQRREIDAGTALQFSVLGMSTSLSGVINLFVCGYFIKLWGPRWSFVSQTMLLGLRVSTQVIGVTLGGRTGEIVFQTCQAIGMVGGPRGYQLVLNTAVSEVVAPKDRTAVFGRLQGSIMLGTAFGYLCKSVFPFCLLFFFFFFVHLPHYIYYELTMNRKKKKVGGVLGDIYNIRRPFEVAFFLYLISSLYGALFLPSTGTTTAKTKVPGTAARGLNSFFAPLRVIVPHKYRLESGQVMKNYGMVFLALGIFLGVFASGYAPLLLQMYATSTFHFTTTSNGWLMFLTSSIRGLFLLFAFPHIVRVGRLWYNKPQTPLPPTTLSPEDDEDDEDAAAAPFDLFFVRYSLLTDALVTFLTGLSRSSYQIYLAGILLPLASGSAPAAKGVMTALCPGEQRGDAIGAITLVESAAMLATQGLFGLIFAAFADLGRPGWTFFCNAGIAVLGFAVLFLARLPPGTSVRVDDDDNNDNDNNGNDD
ncbi:hypothetical protein GGS20DRAFT_412330 [Poronia punctata]|nr:hypothetical protein GGS20DRAFT_412330 [Poronia punctata]